MTPRPKSTNPKSELVTVRLVGDMADKLRAIQERDGIPLSEQVRRGIDMWLVSKGVGKTRGMRAITRTPR